MPKHVNQIESACLQASVPFAVVMPDGEGPFPVLYDLHGLLSDEGPYDPAPTGIQFFEKLAFPAFQQIADTFGVAIVKVNGGKGWYLDSPRIAASQYASHLIDEVIPFIEANYAVVPSARTRGISGHSMGGMGVLQFLCRWPDKFSVGTLHCGSLRFMPPEDHRGSYIEAMMSDDELRAAFPDNFLEGLIRPDLALRITVGKDDKARILDENLKLHAFLVERQQPHDYTETPGGHEFAPTGWAGLEWAAQKLKENYVD